MRSDFRLLHYSGEQKPHNTKRFSLLSLSLSLFPNCNYRMQNNFNLLVKEAIVMHSSDSLYCTFSCTPSTSRSSCSSCGPCIRRLTPRGKPRHDAKLIELMCTQFVSISLTASSDTDEPHRFKWLHRESIEF